MVRYVWRRMVYLVITVFIVAVLVFTLMTFCPGDPATIILGGTAKAEDVAYLNQSLGLNDPFIVRLGRFLSNTFIHFDFGTSWMSNAPIKETIMERLPQTIIVAFSTIFISALIGIPMGVIAAVKQGRFADNACMVLSLIGISIPNFWLAMLLVLLFSVKLDLLPALGIGSFEFYILPALAGSTGGIAMLARQTRSAMLEVIRSDFIITARAKGVPEQKVILKHAFKNALIPIITLLGTFVGRMLGGTMIIETIFSIPGMGSYIISAVNSRDYPVVQIGSIFLAAIFSLCMVIVDVMYAAVDPRIKAQYQNIGRRRMKK